MPRRKSRRRSKSRRRQPRRSKSRRRVDRLISKQTRSGYHYGKKRRGRKPIRFRPYPPGRRVAIIHLDGTQYDRAPDSSWSGCVKAELKAQGREVPTVCPIITKDWDGNLVKCTRRMYGKSMHGAHVQMFPRGQRGIMLVCSHHNPGNHKTGVVQQLRAVDLPTVFLPMPDLAGVVPPTPVDRATGRRTSRSWYTGRKAPPQPRI